MSDFILFITNIVYFCIQDILIIFRGRFKKYIYISSDSVYEVSKQKNHNGFSKETDAVREDDNLLQ